jgi:hypothetical protein
VLHAGAAPSGLDLCIEVGGADILIQEDFQIYVQPQVNYAFGDSGLPEVDIGTIEGWVEYEILIPRLLVTIGDDNALTLESLDLEGYLYSIAAFRMWILTLELELDFYYAPEFQIGIQPSFTMEKELGPGTITVGVNHNLGLFDQLELGDTEFFVNYEIGLRWFAITFEIEPVITADGEFNLSTLALIQYSL